MDVDLEELVGAQEEVSNPRIGVVPSEEVSEESLKEEHSKHNKEVLSGAGVWAWPVEAPGAPSVGLQLWEDGAPSEAGEVYNQEDLLLG